LTDVTVDEGTFTGTGTLGAVDCPPSAASLIPGANVTCVATYVATQEDVNAGSIANTATATATAPSGDLVTSPPGDAVVTIPADPALTITKSTAATQATHVGQIIEFRFVVTNAGNVTL